MGNGGQIALGATLSPPAMDAKLPLDYTSNLEGSTPKQLVSPRRGHLSFQRQASESQLTSRRGAQQQLLFGRTRRMATELTGNQTVAAAGTEERGRRSRSTDRQQPPSGDPADWLPCEAASAPAAPPYHALPCEAARIERASERRKKRHPAATETMCGVI